MIRQPCVVISRSSNTVRKVVLVGDINQNLANNPLRHSYSQESGTGTDSNTSNQKPTVNQTLSDTSNSSSETHGRLDEPSMISLGFQSELQISAQLTGIGEVDRTLESHRTFICVQRMQPRQY